MSKALQGRRPGFTLIEVLVTLILVGLLAAFVFPVVTQQLGQTDAPRLAQDLGSVKTGVEVFNTNVRTYPGDLDDLTDDITVTDKSINGATGTVYTTAQVNRWEGPYLDAITIPAGDAVSGTAFLSGYDAAVQADLVCVSSAAGVPAAITCASGAYVSAKVTGLSKEQFTDVNNLLDSGETGTIEDTGKWRCIVSGTDCTTSFYLLSPWRK